MIAWTELTSFLCKVECRGRWVASAGEADLLSNSVLGDILFRVVDHRSRNVDGVDYQRVVRIALDQGNRETPLNLKSDMSVHGFIGGTLKGMSTFSLKFLHGPKYRLAFHVSEESFDQSSLAVLERTGVSQHSPSTSLHNLTLTSSSVPCKKEKNCSYNKTKRFAQTTAFRSYH